MKKLLWIGLVFLVILAGCSLVGRDFYRTDTDPTKGTVVLILDGRNLPTKTIAPELSMDVSEYSLVFDFETGTAYDFEEQIGSSSTLYWVKGGMEPGNWTVTVEAYNGDPLLIGGGTQAFSIVEGDETAVIVDVVPTAGNGDLTISLSWPDNVGANEELTAILIPDLTTPATSFQDGFVTNSNGTDPRTAVYDTINDTNLDPLPSGYYTMRLQIKDGDALLWGWVEAVRILAGQDTVGTFNLTTLEGSGGVDITAFMQVEITFDPTVIADFAPSAGLTVEALTDPIDPGSYAYEWYLDGELIPDAENGVTGAVSETIAFAGGSSLLTVGNHNLSVLVTTAADALSSGTISFTVVE